MRYRMTLGFEIRELETFEEIMLEYGIKNK